MISSSKTSQAFPLQEVRSKPAKRNSSKNPRFCEHPDCHVKLSVYNMTYYCSKHEGCHAKPSDFI